ncbi:cadherin-86C-like [Scaptodrosophila lebanonensis]|uniref:Cadherin-86C-like n=1 Tax=Drosophila lebanonensis TaxID=7225 RepID=A0A6J2U1D1_DROLE|nr:cadherin-86C-like [Scaptodrosophila lebanonensis]
MGRREAWSTEKPSDLQTKPTRWEYQDGRETVDLYHRKIDNLGNKEMYSAGLHQKHVYNKNSRTTADRTYIDVHNRKTDLITDGDPYIQDDFGHRHLENNVVHFAENEINKENKHARQVNFDRMKHDDDSMRRHEIERGSDICTNTEQISFQNKEELFTKNGNVEILQLRTRDRMRSRTVLDEENTYANIPNNSSTNLTQPHLLMVDNMGKEILMRRFIEEQPDGKQIIREHYQIVPGDTYIKSMPNEIKQASIVKMEEDTFNLGKSGPNSIIYSQTEPEIKITQTPPSQAIDTITHIHPTASNITMTHKLEKSLNTQNALLRQILLEKTKLPNKSAQHEITLETQSLPGQSSVIAIATQTDCEAGTQTETVHNLMQSTFGKFEVMPSRRRARSENDDFMSENSKGVYYIKRRIKTCTRNRVDPHQKILIVEDLRRKLHKPTRKENNINKYVNELGEKSHRTDLHKESNASFKSQSLNREILMEITDSFSASASSDEQYYEYSGEEQDENDIIYSSDSDANEIVIRENKYLPRSIRNREMEKYYVDDENNYHYKNEINKKSPNDVKIHSCSEPEVRERLSRLDHFRHTLRKKNFHQSPVSKLKKKICKIDTNPNTKNTEIPSSKHLFNARSHPGENEPKYMENKPFSNDRTLTESSKLHNLTRKKILSSEKLDLKTSKSIKPTHAAHKNRIQKRTESSSHQTHNGNRMLKEDRDANRRNRPNVKRDTSHPLLQHSEHRFERENAPDIPPPPTKLPHYMYPETPPYATRLKKDEEIKQKPSPIKENEVKVSNSHINVCKEDQNCLTEINAPKHDQIKLNVSKLEDDHDSGIAMNSLLNSMGRRNPITEKKSVFSIAYDDISRVKKITSGAESPHYS